MQLYIRSNLAYLRAARGNLSQQKIAQATGIGQKTLSALETGTSQGIEFKTLSKLCTYLHCTPGDLLVMEEEADYTPVTKNALLKADKLIAKAKAAAKRHRLGHARKYGQNLIGLGCACKPRQLKQKVIAPQKSASLADA